MKKTCSKSGKEFLHSSSLSKHKKTCGATRLLCPFCRITLSRPDALKRHVDRYCKQRPSTTPAISVQQVEPGTKRAAEHTFGLSEDAKLHEIQKRRLVDYESSSNEEVDRAVPWRGVWTGWNSWEVLWNPSFAFNWKELVRGDGGVKSSTTCNFTPPSINYDRPVHAIILVCPSWKPCMRLFAPKSRPWTM